MFHEKRGQAATEYLIMLAILLVILLSAVSVLGGFRESEMGVAERDSAAYWAGAEIGIIRAELSGSGNSSIVFRNNKNFPVLLLNATLGEEEFSLGGVELAPGQSSRPIPAPIACGAAQGEWFSISASISYSDVQLGHLRNFTGEKPIVGTCR